MASGDTLFVFTPHANEPPSSSAATLDTRNGRPCLDFDAGATEAAVFTDVLPRHYAGGGLTVQVEWASSTDQTTGGVRWDVQIERVQNDTTDLDADGFAAVQSATAAAPTSASVPVYDTITLTDGAQIDSLAVGEQFRLKIQRDHDHAGDDMTGDAELYTIEVKET